jgi:hypothetical protein
MSPKKSPFPLLKLPLELRQQIFSYLLPRTVDHSDPNPLASHARNFSAVQKRGLKGMALPQKDAPRPTAAHVVWRRGNIQLLSVCRQLHDECAGLLYGNNIFLLFITFSGISFRFNWLLPSGLAPSRRFDFLELLPKQYMALIKKVVVNVDHVDSYLGMIKYNVSGKGLTYGLQKQVQRLIDALRPPSLDHEPGARRCLYKVHVRISNGNAVIDQIKSEAGRQKDGQTKVAQDLEEMLAPFGDLHGVRDVAITGAVSKTFARILRERMMSDSGLDDVSRISKALTEFDLPPSLYPNPHLCVYGNDI